MEDFIQKIKTEAVKKTLDPRERVSVRENLLLFMKENPLKVATKPQSLGPVQGKRVISPYVPSWLSSIPRIPIGALALALLVFLGGISYSAGSAVPGNLLYPMKTGFNEKISSLFTFSTVGSVAKSISRLDTRLSEAEQLASKGSLGQTQSSYLQNTVSNETKKISDGLTTLQTKGDYQNAVTLSTQVEVALKSHQALLSELALQNTDSVKNDVSSFLFSVQDKTDAIRATKSGLVLAFGKQTNTDIETSALTKLKSTEERLAYAEKQATPMSDTNSIATFSAESTTSAPRAAPVRTMAMNAKATGIVPSQGSTVEEVTPETKIARSREAYDKGNVLFQNGQYTKAYLYFDESAKLLEEARLMKKFGTKYNLTITISNDDDQKTIESLPVTLTATTSLSTASSTPKSDSTRKASTSKESKEKEKGKATSTERTATSSQKTSNPSLGSSTQAASALLHLEQQVEQDSRAGE